MGSARAQSRFHNRPRWTVRFISFVIVLLWPIGYIALARYLPNPSDGMLRAKPIIETPARPINPPSDLRAPPPKPPKPPKQIRHQSPQLQLQPKPKRQRTTYKETSTSTVITLPGRTTPRQSVAHPSRTLPLSRKRSLPPFAQRVERGARATATTECCQW